MQANASAAPLYRSVGHALRTIIQQQGVLGLYRVRQQAVLHTVVETHSDAGNGPNVPRAMLVGVSQPPSYDEAKHHLILWGVGNDRSLLVHSM